MRASLAAERPRIIFDPREAGERAALGAEPRPRKSVEPNRESIPQQQRNNMVQEITSCTMIFVTLVDKCLDLLILM